MPTEKPLCCSAATASSRLRPRTSGTWTWPDATVSTTSDPARSREPGAGLIARTVPAGMLPSRGTSEATVSLRSASSTPASSRDRPTTSTGTIVISMPLETTRSTEPFLGTTMSWSGLCRSTVPNNLSS